ncbi:MAG TPA: ORF6N domain-containing protein [Gemmatimonadales bacterium]|nr:ORF6N domain-containing protein [Gemmatimonadales bacterium]
MPRPRARALLPAVASTLTSRIHLIRGMRVMLGPDLAELYGVEARALTQAVKRNRRRFPADFSFQLTMREVSNLKSQIVISSWGGARSRPSAFTEQGVAMLSSVLRSPRAVKVNVAIMRAFVRVRTLLDQHAELSRRLDDLERRYDGNFEALYRAIKRLMAEPAEPPRPRIGFHATASRRGRAG